MKKIIAAFDGLRFSESAKMYAVKLAKQNNAHLVGVFLDDYLRHGYKIYDLVTSDGNTQAKQKKLELKDANTRAAAVAGFEKTCRSNSVAYTIHHNRNAAIRELLRETIYADLLIIDGNETLTSYKEKAPSGFIRDLLSNMECPVIVTPGNYKEIDRLILLYDGCPASVYAIKMFSYLLPALKDIPAEVITVKEAETNLHVPDNKLMKEFMKRHFPKAVYKVLKGDPETEILKYLQTIKSNPLIISGAYQRGMVSRWFRPSMADGLMKDGKLPLFIAHKK